ncbi:MAG: nucleotidyltransferase domain-containing protein [Patescibacteria group bacterium]
MAVVHVEFDRSRIVDFCRKWKITRMAFFGSVLRDDFRPDSDVDVMVAFSLDSQWSLFDMVDMKLELEKMFKRDVDIVEDGTIRNPIKRRCIYENWEVVYESKG